MPVRDVNEAVVLTIRFPTITAGSARVFLYERRSRAVVIGDAFRSRLEAGLAAWAASMSATAICRPRAPPLGHELPADE
jgi:hypothetical protein